MRPANPPQYVQPAARDNGGRLELCPPDVASELTAVLAEEEREGFRFRLVCRRILEALNGAYRESEGARRRYPVNWAYLNPQDMAAGGIAEGDLVRIESAAGHILGVARGEEREEDGEVRRGA